MTFPLVQIKAVETLLKNPKIGVSEIAKKCDLIHKGVPYKFSDCSVTFCYILLKFGVECDTQLDHRFLIRLRHSYVYGFPCVGKLLCKWHDIRSLRSYTLL